MGGGGGEGSAGMPGEGGADRDRADSRLDTVFQNAGSPSGAWSRNGPRCTQWCLRYSSALAAADAWSGAALTRLILAYG